MPANHEVAPDVVVLPLGRGWRAVNACLIRGGSGWVLVDAGWKGDADAIAGAVAAVAGAGARPEAILLTHVHPDHSGAALDLAHRWDCRVWVHERERPLALGEVDALWRGTGPLDRWFILPALRAAGRQRMADVLARESLGEVLESLDVGESPPGLPGWRVLQTPGHTPGHVAFLREEDRAVLSGDALVTVQLNSPAGMLAGTRRVSDPPWIATWDWTAARGSARALLQLEPQVLAGGHGEPMDGGELRDALAAYARRHSGAA